VVLPTYNSGDLLTPTIDSILNQSHRDFEFVIVDDGSTDGTLERLRQVAQQDARVRLVSEGHGGISRALNLGIERSRAPLIAIMNHDDVARPERLARQVAFLDAHPAVVAVGSAMQIIDLNGNAMGFAHYATDHKSMVEALDAGYQPVGHPTLTFRREAVMALGGYRDYFAYAEDYDLLLRLAERHELANLPDVLLDYRAHSHNTTSRQRPEQELAARFGLYAARLRRAGRPDPTIGRKRARLADLPLFELPDADKASLFMSLAEAAIWAAAVAETTDRLAEAERYVDAAAGYGAIGANDKRLEIIAAWTSAGRPARASIVRLKGAAVERLQEWRRVPGRMRDRERQRRLEGETLAWLIRCSVGQPRVEQAAALPTPPVGRQLVSQALWHGVLPQVIQSISSPAAGDLPDLRAEAVRKSREATALSLMLQQVAKDLERRIGGLPAMVIKGPVFSALYPSIDKRPFTDIDLLIDPSALPAIGELLQAMGFALAEASPDAGEWKWLHAKNEAVMVEVQTNLVHMPRQRSVVSLDYASLAAEPSQAAVNLLIAVVHASLHQFERLRLLSDIRHAALALASDDDVARFAALASRTGATLAARTALHLTAGIYAEPSCDEIVRALPGHPLWPVAASLITPGLLRRGGLRADGARSWQQKVFWRLLAIPTHGGAPVARPS